MEAKRIKDYRSYKISDQAVIERVLKGEKELYEILLRRYNQTLYRIIRGYLKDESEIEDVMQNVWLKAWEKLHQFRYDSAFSTWLIRIGINEALLQIRNKKSDNLYSLTGSVNRYKLARMKAPTQMNPDNRTLRLEIRGLLEEAIDQLPPKYRAVYIIREVEEMDTSETARCLQLTESNVKVRLHRARLLLKDLLMDIADDAELFEFGNQHCDQLVDRVMNGIL